MKKIISLILSMTMLTSAVSCSERKESATSDREILNYIGGYINDGALILGDEFIDLETMEYVSLCNIPNCNHMTSHCITEYIDARIPTIVDGCVYFFTDDSESIEKDGKADCHLTMRLMKYDYSDMKISTVYEFEGGNSESSTMVLGDEMYFIAGNGNPKYDEAGNISSFNSGGKATLFGINLKNEEVTNYGEVFDWEKYRKIYSGMHTNFIGKYGDELYMKVTLNSGVFTDMIVCFNLETKEFRELPEKRIVEAMDGKYIVCSAVNGNSEEYDVALTLQPCDYDLHIENLETGEVIDITEVEHSFASILDGKVWYDNKCYDIETGKTAEINDCDTTHVLGQYNDGWIINENDEETAHYEYRYISSEELEKIFNLQAV